MLPATTVRFEWKHGGSSVNIAGSFNDWASRPMKKSKYGVWSIPITLPPGSHQYKFIVDGKWCYDITKPTCDDGSGNINNLFNVYDTLTISELGTPDYRVYFYLNETAVSPFHDIPLWEDRDRKIANMVVEIPKGTRPKLEISKSDVLNPIKQDTKNGKLRSVHDPYPFNYGAFPQTWENPQFHDDRTNAKGDNDPLDVCDISSIVKKTGDVVLVKILGTYAMIDSGETDWKIIAIDVNDPEAEKYHTEQDIPPEKLKEVFTFLRDYKIPDGNPPNQFAFNSELKDTHFAMDIVDETHAEWLNLISGKIPKTEIKLAATQKRCPTRISATEAESAISDQQTKNKK